MGGFGKLVAAITAAGVDLSDGEYTLLAPADSSIDKHVSEVGTPIDADILKYHVIKGKKTLDQLNADQETLQGGTLTSYRKFRKNWPANVEADNGIIHAIDTVLVPGAYTGSR